MQTIFITGANRGFGLEFARQYAARGDRVFGACRVPETAAELAALPGVQVLQLDSGDALSIQVCAAALVRKTDHLDVLINNAGIGYGAPTLQALDALETLTMESQMRVMQVNAVGPLLIAQALLPLLRKGEAARIINIASWFASAGERTPEYRGSFGYAASKAALAMYSRVLGYALAPEGILCAAMDPGWAKTDMGGASAEQDVGLTVTAMIDRIAHMTPAESGRFLLWLGGETEW